MFVVQDTPLDREVFRQSVSNPGFGAILIFEGVARDHFDGRPVTRLEYEAYGEMARAEMQKIAEEATAKWPQVRISIGHRTGVVAIEETSLIIAVGAPHRPESYEASRFVLETIKERLPVWKKEVYADGEDWKANA